MTTTLSQSIQPHVRTIDGLSIRYAESEPRDDHALLLSPWPESIHAFDQMWERLAEHAHLVAVDLPGFGHSERRDSLLAPQTMDRIVRTVLQAVEEAEAHRKRVRAEQRITPGVSHEQGAEE